MNITGINYESFADGVGCRCTIFISGCRHGCKGCHNKETWDFNCGVPVSDSLIKAINEEIDKRPFIDGITLSGGDPVYSMNDVLNFINKIHHKNNIWLYTGFTWEELIQTFDAKTLKTFNVIVDGMFVEEKRDIRLAFRGSSNQRIIDVQKTINNNNQIIAFDI